MVQITISDRDGRDDIKAEAFLLVYADGDGYYTLKGQADLEDMLSLSQYLQLSVMKNFLQRFDHHN